MPKNHLIMGEGRALAVVEGRAHEALEIDDPKLLAEIEELVRKRKQIGIELSRKLQGHGLIASRDDEDTLVDH